MCEAQITAAPGSAVSTQAVHTAAFNETLLAVYLRERRQLTAPTAAGNGTYSCLQKDSWTVCCLVEKRVPLQRKHRPGEDVQLFVNAEVLVLCQNFHTGC